MVAPDYVEHDPPEADAVELVREHARGKARSVAAQAGNRPVLGVDTAVSLGGRIFGKPASAEEAERMLEELAGETHVVVSGLCIVTPGWELVEHASTRVTFRELTPRELAHHMTHGEWEGRAGGYAIQGRGAALVEQIEGDYLNVVGLPAALLVRHPRRALSRARTASARAGSAARGGGSRRRRSSPPPRLWRRPGVPALVAGARARASVA